MKSFVYRCLLGAILLAAAPADAGELRVGGGHFLVDGQLLASALSIESGARMSGNGSITATTVIRGDLSPGTTLPDNVGTQTITGVVTFENPSRFLCHAITHDALDRLVVNGTVNGDCSVVMTKEFAAMPVNATIVKVNGPASFSGFTPADSWAWRLTQTGTVDLVVTTLRDDGDVDGLPDWWELTYFGDRYVAGPTADSDGDGSNNREEYIANTVPGDSNSVFRIIDISRVSTNLAIRWKSAPGRKYHVLTRNAVSNMACTTAAVLTAYSQPVAAWTNTGGVVDKRFYSLEVEEN